MSSLPQRLASPILALPRAAKRLVALLLDAGLCVLAVWLAYFLRLGEFVSLSHGTPWAQGAALAAAVSIALALPVFIVSGLYRAIFRYSGWPALLAVARAVAVYAVLYGAIFMVGGSRVCRARWASSSRFCCSCWLGCRGSWCGCGWEMNIVACYVGHRGPGC